MDTKPRFSLLMPRASDIRISVPLLLLAVSLLLSCPGVAQEYWMLDLSIERPRFVRGEWFEAGSLIDIDSSVQATNEWGSAYVNVWLIGPTGKRVYATVQKKPSPFVSFPWNNAEHNFACDESFSSGAQTGYVVLALLALPMVVLPFFAAQGTGKPGRYWWFIASFFLLINEWNMVGAPSYLKASATDCKEARKVIAAHAHYYSRESIYRHGEYVGLLPIHANEAAPLRRVRQHIQAAHIVTDNLSWEVILLLMLSFQIPAAISGAHYLFIRHPAERHVRRRPDKPSEVNVPGFANDLGKEDINNPPPDFMLKNKARRIRNLTALFRAETEAAEAAVEQQRATRPEGKKP
jgi:hypothetical protein